MNRTSKNYVPPVKMASAGGVMLNMNTVKSITGYNGNTRYKSYIQVTYHNGSKEDFSVDGSWQSVINKLMEQMK